MIIAAVAILGGVGLVFAILIALANRKLKVWEDPRIDVVTGMLPGANCGACGMPGCRAFAEKLVKGDAKPAGCNVAVAEARSDIASYLGVDAGTAVKTVARMMCAGGTYVSEQQAEYRGFATCAAASAVAGGGKGCAWGCLGLADCVRSCTFDAMRMRGRYSGRRHHEVHGMRRLCAGVPEGPARDSSTRSPPARSVQESCRR